MAITIATAVTATEIAPLGPCATICASLWSSVCVSTVSRASTVARCNSWDCLPPSRAQMRLLGHQDPLHQRLQVRVRDIVRRHRNRAPGPAASILDLLLELRGSAGVAGVLRGDFLVGRSDDLLFR